MLRAPCILVACLRRPSFPRSCCSLPSVRARCLPRRLLTSRQPPPPPPLRVQPLRGVCHQCSGRGFSTALYLSVQLADVFSVSVCVQSLSAVYLPSVRALLRVVVRVDQLIACSPQSWAGHNLDCRQGAVVHDEELRVNERSVPGHQRRCHACVSRPPHRSSAALRSARAMPD